jgi:hypothetical protein
MPGCLSLHDLALSRLRQLFPNSRMVAELDRKLRLAALIAASKRPCRVRACPFPVVDLENGLCRGHAADRLAQYSVLPSALGNRNVPQPASHHAREQPTNAPAVTAAGARSSGGQSLYYKNLSARAIAEHKVNRGGRPRKLIPSAERCAAQSHHAHA